LATVFDTLLKFVESFLLTPDRDVHIRPSLCFPLIVLDELLDPLAFSLRILLEVIQFLLGLLSAALV
jgi:hypothetical protein